MKKILVLNTFLLLALMHSFAQKISELDMYMNRTVTVDHDTLKIVAGILEESVEIKPDYRLYYYWYKSSEIKRTRGGFSGKILHGSYIEYFSDKSIRIKGEFLLGLKTGEWKEWKPNGELVSIANWFKGIKHGIYREFDDEGHIITEGVYKKGLKQGTWVFYEKEEVVKKIAYKDGEEIDNTKVTKSKKHTNKSKKDKKEKKQAREAGKDDSMTPVIDSNRD